MTTNLELNRCSAKRIVDIDGNVMHLSEGQLLAKVDSRLAKNQTDFSLKSC